MASSPTSTVWITVVMAVVIVIAILTIGGVILFMLLQSDKEQTTSTNVGKKVDPPAAKIPALLGFTCLEGDYLYAASDSLNDRNGSYAPIVSMDASSYQYYTPSKDTRINIVVDNKTNLPLTIYGMSADTTHGASGARDAMIFPANTITSLKDGSTNYAVYRNQLLYYSLGTQTNQVLTNDIRFDGTKYYLLVTVTTDASGANTLALSYCL